MLLVISDPICAENVISRTSTVPVLYRFYILFQALIELLDQVEDVISVEPKSKEKVAHSHDEPAKPASIVLEDVISVVPKYEEKVASHSHEEPAAIVLEDVINVEPKCEEKVASRSHDEPAKPAAILQKSAESFCARDQRKESTIYFFVLEVHWNFSYLNRSFM